MNRFLVNIANSNIDDRFNNPQFTKIQDNKQPRRKKRGIKRKILYAPRGGELDHRPQQGGLNEYHSFWILHFMDFRFGNPETGSAFSVPVNSLALASSQPCDICIVSGSILQVRQTFSRIFPNGDRTSVISPSKIPYGFTGLGWISKTGSGCVAQRADPHKVGRAIHIGKALHIVLYFQTSSIFILFP
jgi:hypothetical protein